MSSDNWAPGDLALCVNIADRDYPELRIRGTAGKHLRSGAAYKILHVDTHPETRNTRLWVGPNKAGGSWRFRKIRPLTDAERCAELRDLPVPHPENANA